jgi:uncharacterized protein (DUF302 family)
LERFVAKRMGATTYEADTSHVPMLSNPGLVLDVIRTAAKAVTSSQRVAWGPPGLRRKSRNCSAATAAGGPGNLLTLHLESEKLEWSTTCPETRHNPPSRHRRLQLSTSGSRQADRSRWCAGSSKARYLSSIPASPRRYVSAKLSIFGERDHGVLLQIAGGTRNAIQYDIGNPLTASKMTRHQLPAALYAPLRVVLFEDEHGRGIFEYDKPSSFFGQFGDDRVTEVGCYLDTTLKGVLRNAAE